MNNVIFTRRKAVLLSVELPPPWQTGAMDLELPAFVIPAAELTWRFSRSSGPGGQHVNTSDSRVELLWDISASEVLREDQRELLLLRLARRLHGAGVVTVTASEQRSQRRNREQALQRLAALITAALAPDPPQRKRSKPSRGSKMRHRAAKEQRSATKALRRRPRLG